MLHVEDGAWPILEAATDRYEQHFGQEFPTYEHTDVTKSKNYDVSVAGAKRLANLIDEHIADNDPVPIPDGYSDRLY